MATAIPLSEFTGLEKYQVVRFPARDVEVHKLGRSEEGVDPCRYVQRCGRTARYQIFEKDGKSWGWCGNCEPGRKL